MAGLGFNGVLIPETKTCNYLFIRVYAMILYKDLFYIGTCKVPDT